MSEIHSIRLHGPWNARVLECFESNQRSDDPTTDSANSTTQRTKIPSDWGDWLGPQFRGRVCYERIFHLPTGLDQEQRVWLVVQETDFRATVELNDMALGHVQLGTTGLRTQVEKLLRGSNRLRIEVELPVGVERGARNPLAGGLIGEVRLEIEER